MPSLPPPPPYRRGTGKGYTEYTAVPYTSTTPFGRTQAVVAWLMSALADIGVHGEAIIHHEADYPGMWTPTEVRVDVRVWNTPERWTEQFTERTGLPRNAVAPILGRHGRGLRFTVPHHHTIVVV